MTINIFCFDIYLNGICCETIRHHQSLSDCVYCKKNGIILRAVWESNHTAPGIRAKGHTAWCRFIMGVWLLSQLPLPRQRTGEKECWHRTLATGKVGKGGTAFFHMPLWHSVRAHFLARGLLCTSVLILGSPGFPELQMSQEFSSLSYSNVLS